MFEGSFFQSNLSSEINPDTLVFTDAEFEVEFCHDYITSSKPVAKGLIYVLFVSYTLMLTLLLIQYFFHVIQGDFRVVEVIFVLGWADVAMLVLAVVINSKLWNNWNLEIVLSIPFVNMIYLVAFLNNENTYDLALLTGIFIGVLRQFLFVVCIRNYRQYAKFVACVCLFYYSVYYFRIYFCWLQNYFTVARFLVIYCLYSYQLCYIFY